jgi:hypothetical protein
VDNLKDSLRLKFRATVAQEFATLQSWLSYVQAACVDNVFELVVDEVNGSAYYLDFFQTIAALGNTVSQENWDRFKGLKTEFDQKKQTHVPVRGLQDLFVKLASPYQNENSVKMYKGAASELLSAFRVAGLQPTTAVRVPMKLKGIAPGFATTPDTSRTALPGTKIQQQDIDRTERSGTDKFYVEVKADGKTADKAHGWNVAKAPQLTRYKEVRDTRGQGPKQLNRHVAVEITDPGDWVELFLGGTLGLYVQQGFWLFVGGQRFTPLQLAGMWNHVKPIREAIDKRRFLAPSAFANGALPDLTPCFVVHTTIGRDDWFKIFQTRTVRTIIDALQPVRVDGVWIPLRKLEAIDRHVEPHIDKIDEAKFPQPEAFKQRDLPDLSACFK